MIHRMMHCSHKTYWLLTVVLAFLTISFTGCINAQHNMMKAISSDVNLEGKYYQEVYSGIEDGNSKILVFFPKQPKHISLKAIYFKGRKATFFPTNEGFLASISTKKNNAFDPKKPLTLNEVNAKQTFEDELGFRLKDTDCVLTYDSKGKSYIMKINDLSPKDGKKTTLPIIPQGAAKQNK